MENKKNIYSKVKNLFPLETKKIEIKKQETDYIALAEKYEKNRQLEHGFINV